MPARVAPGQDPNAVPVPTATLQYSRYAELTAANLAAIAATQPSAEQNQSQNSAAGYAPPVQGTIVDLFRRPEHIGGAGNRGWEYELAAGSEIRAVQAGVVHFAGPVAGKNYVSIRHPDGHRSTYSNVADIAVAKSQPVSRGQLLAKTAAASFHFGVLKDDNYVDPAELFGCSQQSCHNLNPANPNSPAVPAPVRLIAHTGG